MGDIMKIAKSIKESWLLIKRISETIKNETKEQEEWFLPMLLGISAVVVLGNALLGRGVIRTSLNFNTASSFN